MNKLVAIIFIFVIVFPSFSVIASNNQKTNFGNNNIIDQKRGDGKTEYWAVIIGVDYRKCWAYYFNAEQMYNLLPVSDHWDKDHILILTDENATKINIIKAFRWLDRMDDGDDICLIYYCAHGGSSKYNYFPFDLRDRGDEYITTWRSENRFINRLINITKNFKLINSWLSWRSHVITDDYFNSMLNKLDSKGVAVILHSCFSGGMIESNRIRNFANTLRKKGRVIMTACEENDTSVNFVFSEFVLQGLQGYGDLLSNGGNGDGIVSAEEAFNYAYNRTREETRDFCHHENIPVIDDGYEGDLPLTDKNLPPNTPLWINGSIIGKVNMSYVFNVTSTDPEGQTIIYGFDWDVKNFYPWYFQDGLDVEEWSKKNYDSGEVCSISHLWDKPGIYCIRVKAKDEFGSEILQKGLDYYPWSKPWMTIIASDDEVVDQFQLEFDRDARYKRMNRTEWLAQSFTPDVSKLSKVKLFLEDKLGPTINYTLYIRSNLTGSNLVEFSKKIERLIGPQWIEFDFEDIDLTPGNKYYILIKSDGAYGQYWFVNGWNQNYEEIIYTYLKGECYISYDSGENWEKYIRGDNPNIDLCFVTYG